MNLVGRQMQRTGAAVHHQRQYSDNFMEAPSKWLQSTSPPQVLCFVFLVVGCLFFMGFCLKLIGSVLMLMLIAFECGW